MSHPLKFRIPILPVCAAVALLAATSAASAQATGNSPARNTAMPAMDSAAKV